MVGLGDDPLLACGRCAEKVLRLSVTGHPIEEKEVVQLDPQLSIFDQIQS